MSADFTPEKEDYKILTPFKMQVLTNFPYIEADFDALTNYQLLCKIVEYLNNVIHNENEVTEQVTGLYNAYVSLQNYVNNYFDNLDLQPIVDNKLDEMAEDGTLADMIAEYIKMQGQLVYNSVSEMKQAENIQNGSFLKTYGFYNANDGGGALYKARTITNEDTVDEKFIIALHDETLVAELIIDDQINVKQIGAYGDNDHDDTSVITAGYNYALEHNKILYLPKYTYKVSTLNLKSIVLKCYGYINNSEDLIVGAISTGATLTDVYIFKCNNVKIEGAKNSLFNIEYSNNIVLSANGSDSTISSIAYNKIKGISCNHITLTSTNMGWINENLFIIKRCMTGILIDSDGYSHNNNHFENISIEGSSATIQINKGHSNYITYRGEDNVNIVMGSDPSVAFSNTIQKQDIQSIGATISYTDFNNVRSFNFIGNEYLPSYKCIKLLDLNPHNVKNINSTLYLNDSGNIVGNWSNEFLSDKIDASFPFIIFIKSNVGSQRFYLTCYDENDEKIPGNVYSAGVSYNETDKDYHNTSNANQLLITFAPSSAVKKVQLRIQAGGGATFNNVRAYMYMPFTHTEEFINTINIERKYSNAIPSTLTALSPKWEVGDVVYNTNPANNIYAWICTTAGIGSASVWQEIPITPLT